MNFFEVEIRRVGDKLNVTFEDGQTVDLDLSKLRTIEEKYLDGKVHRVYLGARGENIKLAEDGIRTTLSIKEVLGNTTQLFVRMSDKGNDIIVSVGERNTLNPGDVVYIKFNEEFVHLFDSESENSIMSREYGNK